MARPGAQTTVEPFVQAVTTFIGGPLGRHAARTGRRAYSWINPGTVALAVATVMWVLAVIRQDPCRQVLPNVAPNGFIEQCYSDIPLLYRGRGLVDGNVPYFDSGDYQVLEYPVLTGYFLELMRRITALLGAPVGPGLSEEQAISATNTFYSVNMVALFVLLVVLVVAQLASTPGRRWDTLMIVASPSIILTGLINWDLLPVALTALGILFWQRRQPGVAGVLLGLSMAAKLYAGFLLGPLLLLCLRTGRWREFLRTLGGFLIAWALSNLPVMIFAPVQWREFWTFNSERAGDFGSLWYLFVLAGKPVVDLNLVSTTFFLIGCAAIGVLILLAPTRPRIGQVCFLVLVAFVATNKVYSPQYVLWLLPFLALCRPRWRDWIIFGIGEWLYVMAIWGHLGQYLTPGGGGPDKLFWAATVLRLLTQLWVCAVVVRDILRPEHDLVRVGALPGDRSAYADDPSGGVLDGAPDTPFWGNVQRRGAQALAGVRSVIPPRTRPGTPLPGVTPRIDRWDRAGGRWVGVTWVVSRLLLVAVAVFAMAESGRTFSEVLLNWDAEHYIGLAQDWYQYTGNPEIDKRMAFFPGLPALLKAFMTIGIPGEYVGLVISLIASAFAAAALYRMGGVWAAVLWLCAPAAIFTMMPYTESLFCAFAFWAWERARADKWWQVAILASAACSVRVSGLFLIGALGIMVLTWRMPPGTTFGQRIVGWLKRAVWLIPPALVMFAYAAYLKKLTGSWMMWYEAQAMGWSRHWTPPWQSVKTTLDVILGPQYDGNPGWDLVFTFELFSMAFGLLAVGWLLRRRMWAEAAWVGVQAFAFSTSEWLFSVNRAVLLWFPIWIIAAELIAWKPVTRRGIVLHRGLHIGWMLGSVITMMWWARMFYLGQWSS
ncbi:hypothetical protein CGZ93_14115 [Enemella dayhoffiae]|uniref:DUF2029 domain-containing protein n=1 Tax=Enemella dayhoffiae TaxID=2016507 RepID=A0A255GRZ8_9ACTN|nr:hypothetical protein CGZ93_14115 [Enemella dayhoffiae]